MTAIDMSDLIESKCPFEDYGCASEDFVPVEDVLNREIAIHAVKEFENTKGEGVYVLFYLDGKFHYVCTHSITITAKLTSDKVKEVLRDDTADTINAKFIKRKSKNSDRMVYDIV